MSWQSASRERRLEILLRHYYTARRQNDIHPVSRELDHATSMRLDAGCPDHATESFAHLVAPTLKAGRNDFFRTAIQSGAEIHVPGQVIDGLLRSRQDGS